MLTQELQHNLLQSFSTMSCWGSTDNTVAVGISVANAAVREMCSSICPSQWGSVGLYRLANQSLSPPVLLRSFRLHRAGCRAQSTMPTIPVSAEPMQKKNKKTLTLSSWEVKRIQNYQGKYYFWTIVNPSEPVNWSLTHVNQQNQQTLWGALLRRSPGCVSVMEDQRLDWELVGKCKSFIWHG